MSSCSNCNDTGKVEILVGFEDDDHEAACPECSPSLPATAEHAIRGHVIANIRANEPEATDDDIDDWLREDMEEFRCSWTHETKIPCDRSRYYASKSVAKQLKSGEWVGWTYYFAGGKHGQPSEMPWIEDAYFLEAQEEVVKVLKFAKRPPAEKE